MGEIQSQILKARAEHGWKVEQLAVYAGVSPGTVRRLEAGLDVRASKLQAVLAALGLAAVVTVVAGPAKPPEGAQGAA